MTADLLTSKDLDQLRQALAAGREISLTRSLRGLTVTASTCKGSPAWGCDMLILNGEHPELLYDVAEGRPAGTRFLGKRQPGR